ncbi:testis-expressed protein 50 isoform X2 [Mastomys coucha]|uniref:testis-expressed protein 50 isoform X2 n=1 Tax=Mastomys coucha TaxID=35658 RepID=UPI0012615982|nr:testis-expressed protein 50 isoform X2 [Mastomys coucha]
MSSSGLYRESFSICDGTTWTKVGWEIFPEEVHYLKVKAPPSHYLPYPLDKLCCNLANMDLLQSSLHLIYTLAQALFLILFVLSVHYLWMKWTRHQKKLKKQASLEKLMNDRDLSPFIHDFEQILCRLLTMTSMMSKFLKQTRKLEFRDAKKLGSRNTASNDGCKTLMNMGSLTPEPLRIC